MFPSKTSGQSKLVRNPWTYPGNIVSQKHRAFRGKDSVTTRRHENRPTSSRVGSLESSWCAASIRAITITVASGVPKQIEFKISHFSIREVYVGAKTLTRRIGPSSVLFLSKPFRIGLYTLETGDRASLADRSPLPTCSGCVIGVWEVGEGTDAGRERAAQIGKIDIPAIVLRLVVYQFALLA